ncbi:hypothetical protein FE257_011865 [Aspergillus nanangensis]|uniref:RING-type domain-containing protein n=1 Tax=Aspergillus nanangensis TaxID=2582783 RepID=A0AAD4CH63_ASPNN|nr:hypothetical protein FE257_011865 [Aspergillus nanangensis]
MNSSSSISRSPASRSTDSIPSSREFRRDRYRQRRHRNRSPPRSREGSTQDNIDRIYTTSSSLPWSDEGMSGWSDAVTASTVLSLLHKEPLMPPPGPTSESENERNVYNRRILTCAVCFGQFDNDYYPDSPITAGCNHSKMPGIHICMGCLRHSLDIQVASPDSHTLACPVCNEKLSDEDVCRWASPQTFRAYDRIRTWQILEEDAEFVRCIRPDCGYGQLHAGGLEDPIVVCGSCGTRTCFIHRDNTWHEGLTCAEYEEMAAPDIPIRDGNHQEIHVEVPRAPMLRRGWVNATPEELLSMRVIADIAKPCPSCNVATERVGYATRSGAGTVEYGGHEVIWTMTVVSL